MLFNEEQFRDLAVWCVMSTQGSTRREAWFCLRTQPRREQTAAGHLCQRVGIEVFAPQIPLRRRSSGTRTGLLLRQPLFPGYFFARFHYPQQLRHVISSQGVSGIVRFGAIPSVVADGVIDFLRREIELAQGAPAQSFREGETVRIVNGCFNQLEGLVLSSDSATERVRVLLSLLGQQIQVSVLAAQLVSTEALAAAYPPRLLVEAQDVAPLAR
jgi:transcriptional antiterminator RfaH